MRKKPNQSMKDALMKVMLNEANINRDGFDNPNPYFNPQDFPAFPDLPPQPVYSPHFNPRQINYPNNNSSNAPVGLPGYSKPYWDDQNGRWFIPGPNGYPHFYWDPTYTNPFIPGSPPGGWRPIT
jgi:hypothetical protein